MNDGLDTVRGILLAAALGVCFWIALAAVFALLFYGFRLTL